MKRSPKTPAPKKAKAVPHPRTPVEDISPEEQLIGAPLVGKVRAYDASSREMTLRLEEPLSVGDSLRVKGRHTDLTQPVEHMRVGKRSVQSALPGETALVEVADAVRSGDAVWKL